MPAPGGATRHYEGRQTSFATDPGRGDLSDVEAADAFVETTTSRSFVVGLDVLAPGSASVVAAIGDSITDGDQRDANGVELSVDEDARYPDYLARRLGDAPDGLSVINLGIGGNRIAADGTLAYFGPSLLSRLDADLLWRTDVTDVIVLIGVNDLAIPPAATADEVIANLRAVVAALHEGLPGEQPLNVLVGTLTPVGGAVGLVGPLFVDAETRRADVNAAIRAGLGDGYIDFDAAVRDPADPARLAPEFDGGDGLHLSPAGYARMAEAVDMALLRGRDCGVR